MALANALKLNDDDELSVAVCADARMRSLNRKYRGEDRATDVLAFPADDIAPFLVSRGPLGICLAPHPPLVMGDVVIDYRQVERQARANGNEVAHELAAMLVHGVTHLLGFDHGTAQAEADMIALERRMHELLRIEVSQFGH